MAGHKYVMQIGTIRVLGDIKNVSQSGILTNGGRSGYKVKWLDIAQRGLRSGD